MESGDKLQYVLLSMASICLNLEDRISLQTPALLCPPSQLASVIIRDFVQMGQSEIARLRLGFRAYSTHSCIPLTPI